MDLLHQLIYLQEIQSQCRMAQQASIVLEQVLEQTEATQTIEEGAMKTAEVFRNVHSMLTHVASISQLLWPGIHVKTRRKVRAQELRSLLHLSDEENVLSRRDLRNDLEHFDERLDCWADRVENPRDFWQDFIGSWDVPVEQFKAKPINVMRHFDPDTRTFRFQGKPWNIPEIVEHIKALRRIVDPMEAMIRSLLYPTPGPIQSEKVRFLD